MKMGAWDVGTFDNDTASDWAYELHGAWDLSVVRAAIEAVLVTGADYLEADLAAKALAAGEVIARLRGRGCDLRSYSEAVDRWVDAHPLVPPDELVEQAIEAIDRILGLASELAETWDESDDRETWRVVVGDLRARLG
jgi:hypothetical protein